MADLALGMFGWLGVMFAIGAIIVAAALLLLILAACMVASRADRIAGRDQ